MEPTQTRLFPVADPSQVSQVRRLASARAKELGFDEQTVATLALVLTEAATNLIKHTTARGGEIALREIVAPGGERGVEVLCLDRGPGMANVEACLRDGFSSSATAGTGLGAIRRLSRRFDVYSKPGIGTAVVAEVWPARPGGQPATAKTADGPDLGGISVPKPGEEVCGDAWDVHRGAGRVLVLVADGLGHGPIAAAASREAVLAFRREAERGLSEIMAAVHAALRPTRGAAAAVAALRAGSETLTYCGVGNIAGVVFSEGQSRHLVSHNGTLGHETRSIREFTYPFPPGSLLVMHSDGIGTRWDLSAYPGLALRHPGLVVGTIYRDCARGRDDATAVALRGETP